MGGVGDADVVVTGRDSVLGDEDRHVADHLAVCRTACSSASGQYSQPVSVRVSSGSSRMTPSGPKTVRV